MLFSPFLCRSAVYSPTFLCACAYKYIYVREYVCLFMVCQLLIMTMVWSLCHIKLWRFGLRVSFSKNWLKNISNIFNLKLSFWFV